MSRRSHGTLDEAGRLLAEYVDAPTGARIVHFNCGRGDAAMAFARRIAPAALVLTDRSIAAVHATTATLTREPSVPAEVRLAHGWGEPAREATWDLVCFRIPTDKASLMQLLADAWDLLAVGGRCVIAGATQEGIKSAATSLSALFGPTTVLATKAGHRVVRAVKQSATPADEALLASARVPWAAFRETAVTLRGVPAVLAARPGVFSWEHLDEASAILANVMRIAPTDAVLDLGCGAGALGITAARLAHAGRVTMVDVDIEAVRSADRSATIAGLTNTRALPSDVASAVLEERFDVVVTNPPFHVGKQTDLVLPGRFIRDAWQVLVPGGALQLVANRTLPYEGLIRDQFGRVECLHDGPRFKVLVATRR
jgi:16S rRNA (guanine1207-N2)-methyltransferase